MPLFGPIGVRIGYSVEGAGPPLVLIHGFTASRAAFANNVPLLTDRFTVISVELLGHGDSDAPDDPGAYGPVPAAQRLLGLLDELGYDEALAWAGQALGGELGYSRLFAAPVSSVLPPRLGNSLLLMGSSFVLAFARAVALGTIAARHPESRLDAAINLFCFVGVSIPTFWLALVLILVFAAGLGWLPAGGAVTAGADNVADRLRHLVLPVATLTLASAGAYTRYMRAAMREALGQDHIRTARAKGASEARVIFRHAMRSAMIPVATILALSFGGLVSGALVTETMFAYPGMGKLIYDAVMGNDYNLALAALLLAAIAAMLANLAADLAYGWLDPRVTYR